MSLPDPSVANIGKWSSNAAGILTIAFAVSTLFDFDSNTGVGIDFFVCLLLPIVYLITTLANSHVVKSLNNPLSAFYSDSAVLFAVVYTCYICAIYYLMLTFIRLGNPHPIAQSIVKYKPGTAAFAVDILGYTFLGLSTTFFGLSIDETPNKFLARLMYFHGVVGLVGFLTPFLPSIYEDDVGEDANDVIWQLLLFFWCVVFAPICFLAAQYFRSHGKMKKP